MESTFNCLWVTIHPCLSYKVLDLNLIDIINMVPFIYNLLFYEVVMFFN